MHSVTNYLQHVKQTDAYINVVLQYINTFHMKIQGTVRLAANVTLRHFWTRPTTGKKGVQGFPSVAEKFLQICPGNVAIMFFLRPLFLQCILTFLGYF